MGKPSEVAAEFMKEVGTIGEQEEVSIGETIIRGRNLQMTYFSLDRGIVRAVNDISFDINEGEIFGYNRGQRGRKNHDIKDYFRIIETNFRFNRRKDRG